MQGLKYYDVVVGDGDEPSLGSRVAGEATALLGSSWAPSLGVKAPQGLA
jgi:hypothetical protein